MKRSGPLQRRAPLKRGKPLARKTPLPRRSSTLAPRIPVPGAQPRPKPKKSSNPSKGSASLKRMWRRRRLELYVRSGGRCEVGGCSLDQWGMEAHHRILRSQGGGHEVENLLALCPKHHAYVHEHRKYARMRGYIISREHSPATYAVILHDGRTVRLTTEGGYDVVFDERGEGEKFR